MSNAGAMPSADASPLSTGDQKANDTQHMRDPLLIGSAAVVAVAIAAVGTFIILWYFLGRQSPSQPPCCDGGQTPTPLTQTATLTPEISPTYTSIPTTSISTASPTLSIPTIIGCLPKGDPSEPIYAPAGGVDDFSDRLKAFWNQTGGESLWGPYPITERIREPYVSKVVGSNNPQHLVQYFDKGRMEQQFYWDDGRPVPYGTPKSGLLALELLSGYIRIGDSAYVKSQSPQMPLFSGNSPTYAEFQEFASPDSAFKYNPDAGNRTTDEHPYTYPNHREVGTPRPPDEETRLIHYTVPISQGQARHNLPRAFCNLLMNIVDPGEKCDGRPIRGETFWNATGYPITEPYLTLVSIDSSPEVVMFQAFERRVLVYRSNAPSALKVTATNIGQDYFSWRYYLVPPCP